MIVKIEPLLESIRANFWFVPTVMILLTVVMATFTIWIDVFLLWSLDEVIPIVYSTDVTAIRSLLGTIAAAMITVTSIAFSITIVALTLASSQFGPRLMRNFMKDRTTQVVLGVFISNFLYCIFVFCAISLEPPYNFKPGITVMWAILMTCVSIGFLIHFIHHVSISIQADAVIEDVYCELKSSILRLFPNSEKQIVNAPAEELQDKAYHIVTELRVGESGYVQLIDQQSLFEAVVNLDLQLKVHVAPGNYVVKNAVFAEAFCKKQIDSDTVKKIMDHVVIGSARTPVQDAEFAVNQLVEVALRALSPGINDPFTVLTCIDKLSSALSDLTTKQFPNFQHKDKHNIARLQCKALTFTAIASAAFDQIRQHGNSNTAVVIRLLESLHELALRANSEEQYAFIYRQLNMICEQQEGRNISSLDMDVIKARAQNIKEYLNNASIL